LRDIRLNDLRTGPRDILVLAKHVRWIVLLDDRLLELALAPHAVVVGGVVARMGLPQGEVTVRELNSGLNPLSHCRERLVGMNRHSDGNVHGHSVERIDEIREPVIVDKRVVLDRQPGHALDGVAHGLDARFAAVGRGTRIQLWAVELDLGVDRLDAADIDLAPLGAVSVRIRRSKRRAFNERHVFELARKVD